jgi:hypothetical protein
MSHWGYWSKKVGDAGVDYSTFEIIYSIARRVNTSYVGSLIRIRRDSDNTETDIGTVGTDLDTASIASFCSGTTGRIQKVYNQGSAGATFDVTFYTGTRAIIYQSGAVELVNGKSSILGQTNNGYRTSLLAIANSKMNTYKIHSAVLQTQSGLSNGLIAGELGTAAGNNRRGQFSDTTTNRNLIDNVVDSVPASTAHLLPVQATQSQHRQYSFINFDPTFNANNSISYWNGVLQQQRNYILGWGSNTNFYFHLMRYSIFPFVGRFQEFVLKTTDGSDDLTLLNAVEAEQNAYYGIY